MTVHSTQLGAGHVVSATGVSFYVVPAGKRTIVKSIVAQNSAAGTNRLAVLGLTGGTAEWWLNAFFTASATQGDTVILSPWIVMNAGDEIEVAATSSGIYLVISGAELIV